MMRRVALTILIGITLSSLIPMNVLAQDTLSLSINRSFGMAFGNYISGSFLLEGNGPDSIQNLTVYFNENEVHFVTGNSVSWLFNTGEYLGGPTNITLVGIDNLGVVHRTSTQVVFIAEGVGTLITGAIIVLVIILVAAKYGPRLLRLRKK
ncbi:MAG: hypothetical protein OEV85_10000 [Candidatus Thorarchaeota archaeon]|nr:hypothetical protein [Candidatus Thorarchaeota archaeon]